MKKPTQHSSVRNIVKRQKISTVMKQAAKSLRSEMTPSEKLLWKHLRGNKFEDLHFRRQQVIDGAIVDFYCHRYGLVIEVDGDIHETRKDYDENRDELLVRRNLKVLRVRNEEVVEDIEGVLTKILDACKSLRT